MAALELCNTYKQKKYLLLVFEMSLEQKIWFYMVQISLIKEQ